MRDLVSNSPSALRHGDPVRGSTPGLPSRPPVSNDERRSSRPSTYQGMSALSLLDSAQPGRRLLHGFVRFALAPSLLRTEGSHRLRKTLVITRRTLLAGAGAVLCFTAPTTEAQQGGKPWQIGFLTGGARPPDGAPPLALRQALQDLGYVERQNVIYVSRWADAKQERLSALAAELVALKVHVIVTVGGPATDAARQATPSIPIVMALVGDAVRMQRIERCTQ